MSRKKRLLPKYPVYVPTKGRYKPKLAQTIRFLTQDKVPFYAVVEPQDAEKYTALVPERQILQLPKNDAGLVFARNWILDHSLAAGDERHWQIDDNIQFLARWYRGKRIRCAAGVALRVVDDFTDRYTNIAIAGLNYCMFAAYTSRGQGPFTLNAHVYSCTQFDNHMPGRWRGVYNEDVDICLQVLSAGWCTVLVNAFLAHKTRTMTMEGGNTDRLYSAQDGRLHMAEALRRMWPDVVEVQRRFKRPQHVIKHSWQKFDTPLQRRPDLDFDALPNRDEYGMQVVERKPIQSPRIRKLMDDFNEQHGKAK